MSEFLGIGLSDITCNALSCDRHCFCIQPVIRNTPTADFHSFLFDGAKSVTMTEVFIGVNISEQKSGTKRTKTRKTKSESSISPRHQGGVTVCKHSITYDPSWFAESDVVSKGC